MSPERRSVAGQKPSPVMMVVVGMAGTGVLILAAMMFSMSGSIGVLQRKKVDASELSGIRKSIKELDGVAERVEQVDAKVGRRLDAWGKNISDVSSQLQDVLNQMGALRTEQREKDAAFEQKLALIAADLQALKRDVASAQLMASEASKRKPNMVAAKPAANDAPGTARRINDLERRLASLERSVKEIPRVNEDALRKLVNDSLRNGLDEQLQDAITQFMRDRWNRGGRRRPGGDN